MGLACQNPKVPFCYMGHKSCNSHCKDKIVYKPKICTPQTWQLLLSTSYQLSRKKKSNSKELRGHQRTTQLIKNIYIVGKLWKLGHHMSWDLNDDWSLRTEMTATKSSTQACLFLEQKKRKKPCLFRHDIFSPWVR